MNRRKFITLSAATCCSMFLPSCATNPVTDRKQLLIYGVVLMFTPFIEIKLKDLYDKNMEKEQVQQNNNNLVIV